MNKKFIIIGILSISIAFFLFSGVFSLIQNQFNNSLTTENLTFTGNENIIKYIELPLEANVNSAYLNLSGQGDITRESISATCQGYGAIGHSSDVLDNTGSCINSESYWEQEEESTHVACIHVCKQGAPPDLKVDINGHLVKTWSSGDIVTCNTACDTGSYVGALYCFNINNDYVNPSGTSNSYKIYTTWDGSDETYYRIMTIDDNYFYSGKGRCGGQYGKLWFNYTGGNLIKDASLKIGTNIDVWNYTNWFFNISQNTKITKQTLDFSSVLNTALNLRVCDCVGCSIDGTNCLIPFTFHSDTTGILEYSALNVTYELTLYITLLYPTPNLILSSGSNIALNFTNTTILDTCYWTNDSFVTNYTIPNCVNTTMTLPDGNTTIQIWANNSMFETDTDSVTFLIDTIPPTIQIQSPTNKTYNTSTIWFNATANEEIDSWIVNYNGTNYTGINFSKELIDGNYHLFIYANDSAGNVGLNDSVWFRVDTIPPTINIDSPKPQAYNYNESLPLNFIISDTGVGVSSCWYNLINSTSDSIIPNTTLTSCLNTTFDVPKSDIYTLLLYSNDTVGNENLSSVTFQISLESPAVVLDYPRDYESFKNGTNVYFNFTATDSDGLDECQLWGNWTGSWLKNYTWVSPTSGIMDWKIMNLSEDKLYNWNVWCNDTTGLGSWALNNFTLTIDTINPNVTIDSITTTPGSQTISFNSTEQDANLHSCKYSIFNSSGQIDGTNENVSFTCNSKTLATATDYGTYTLTIYAVDLAGNENSSTKNFITFASSGNTPGGGGSSPEEVQKIPTIALQQIIGDKTYNELERAIFYSKINSFCSVKKTSHTLAIQDFSGECSLKKSDIEIIKNEIFEDGFKVSSNDLILFYDNYNKKKLEQIYTTLDLIKTYDLFTSVLGITNPMRINPPRLDRPFIITGADGNITIEQIFTVNKKVKECSIISGDGFECEVITDNSVKMILKINNTDFLDKIFHGEMSITSDADPQNVEVKRISLFPRVYNLSYKIMGIPAIIFLIMLGILIFIFSIFFIVRGKIGKKLKRRKS